MIKVTMQKQSKTVVPNSLRPYGLQPTRILRGIFQARILEWVAISFSRGSSQPRGRTQGSCIAVRLVKHRATREAQNNTASGHFSKSFTNVIIQYLQLFPLNKEVEAQSELILFATKTCPNCKMACTFLDKAGLAYEKLYAEDNADLVKAYDVKQAPSLVVVHEDGSFEKIVNVSNIRKFIEETVNA